MDDVVRASTLPESAPIGRLRDHLAAGLIGHEHLVEGLLIGLLTGGHVLIEGAPGLAKTRAVRWLAGSIDGSFARIQCTPDLLPSDLTGTAVFHPDRHSFEFVRGPVFHNLVLVDEINRAPPKVQSALLEAMGEQQVTNGGETHALPDPFMVVATQNPIEHEGTFPLPEAQLDRFLLHIALPMPGTGDERRILDLVIDETAATPPRIAEQVTLDDVSAARAGVVSVHLSPLIRDYIVRLVMATRTPPLSDIVEHPVSPRGSIALALAARARAWLHGRDHVLPEDIQMLAADALSHRLVLTWRATAEGSSARRSVSDLVDGMAPL
jgi:MoxR-like ATPase